MPANLRPQCTPSGAISWGSILKGVRLVHFDVRTGGDGGEQSPEMNLNG